MDGHNRARIFRRALLATAAVALFTAACASDPVVEAPGQAVAVVDDGDDGATGTTATTAAEAAAAEGDADDGGQADDGQESTSTTAAAAATPTGDAEIDAIATITGEPAELSTDLSQPDQDRGVLNVNAARSTGAVGDHLATPGMKLIVVDIEVYYLKNGNLFDSAFRLLANDDQYSPINSINDLGDFGGIYNGQVIFEVPQATETMTLEGGIPAGTPGGLTSSFELTLQPGTADEAAAAGTVIGGLVEDADAIEIVGDPALVATDRGDHERATMTIETARVTSRDGDFFAQEGTKLVVVDFNLNGFDQFSNIFDEAFRLNADDEWYSPLNPINETGRAGEQVDVTAIFEVPIDATSYTLEGGAPATLAALPGFPDLEVDDPSATWMIVF